MSVRSTGWKNGVSESVAGAGVDWVNPTNADASDDAYAVAGLSGTEETDVLLTTQFGFAVPSDAVLLGVHVKYEKSRAGVGTCADSLVQLYSAGSAIGNDLKITGNWPVADAESEYGGGGNLWGATLTPAIVNATTFGVGLKTITAGATIPQVDNVQMNVWYETVDEPFCYPVMKVPEAHPSRYPLWVPPGCVLYYDMQDLTNLILDQSGQARHGTNLGTVAVAAPIGCARRLTAASAQYISLAGFPKLAASTIEMWIKVDGTGAQSANAGLVMMGASNTSWGIAISSASPFILTRRSDGSSNQGNNEQTYNAANYPAGWHHIVWTNNASTGKFYQNTVLKKTTANTVANSGTAQTLSVGRFGTYAGADSYFNGDMGLVRIYNRVLTAEEVLALYRSTAWRYGRNG